VGNLEKMVRIVTSKFHIGWSTPDCNVNDFTCAYLTIYCANLGANLGLLCCAKAIVNSCNDEFVAYIFQRSQ
jgi:hypothetical protein